MVEPSDADQLALTAKWYEANLQTLRDLGMYAIKTLVTLNSGAFVVLLTFLGNAASQTKFSLALGSIKWAMLCFLCGIASTAVVIATAYINSMRMSPYDSSKGMAEFPALILYVGFCVFAFVCFVAGVATVVYGVVET
jgi:hypothetical protein